MQDVYIQTACFSSIFREDQSTATFNSCLEKVAEMGYTGIELYHNIYGGHSAKELKKILSQLGLKVLGAHVSFDMMDGQMEYLSELGAKYMLCPGTGVNSHDEALSIAERMNKHGETAKSFGLQYGYHNHDHDFHIFDGEAALETYIAHTDPSLVSFEFDVGWVWRAGFNATELVQKHAGRVPLIHVKETSRSLKLGEGFQEYQLRAQKDEQGNLIYSPELKAEMEEFKKINCKLGEGLINLPVLKPIADAQGTEAYIVEREYAYTGDIFSSLQEDLSYLRKL